jgi:hypothetical protein
VPLLNHRRSVLASGAPGHRRPALPPDRRSAPTSGAPGTDAPATAPNTRRHGLPRSTTGAPGTDAPAPDTRRPVLLRPATGPQRPAACLSDVGACEALQRYTGAFSPRIMIAGDCYNGGGVTLGEAVATACGGQRPPCRCLRAPARAHAARGERAR